MSNPVITATHDAAGTWRVTTLADGLTGYGYGKTETDARAAASKSFQEQVELSRIYVEADRRGECRTCAAIRILHHGFGPSHDGSRNCKSGSIASGGNITHCTCSPCFD